jgi:hypothetical protein
VNGLVKAMSVARDQLTQGIPVDGVEDFRQFVSSTLQHTEQLCLQNRISPQDLPRPSFQAYQYLKEIDLHHLPVAGESKIVSPTIRISNLGTAACHIQIRMMEAARETYHKSLGARKKTRMVQSLIQQQCASIQWMLSKKKAKIDDLPLRSMQTAHWLMYLNDNEHFMLTLQQMTICCEIYEAIRMKNRSAKNAPLLERMTFEFTPMAALYRWRIKDGKGTLSMHPGFLYAEQQVLQAILSSAILRRTPKHSLLIRQMAGSPAFQKISKLLDGHPIAGDALGQYYDLEELFQTINEQYFKNSCQQPKLKWTTRFTRRKFGMYLPSTDTIVVSLNLDQPTVPRYVVEFILYHEVLHKVLGMKNTAKRQIAHTTEFRRRERQFAHYQEAQQFLETLTRSYQA